MAFGATIALLPSALQSQEGPVANDTSRVVIVSEKSPVAAGVLEFLLPTAGYAYAGNWSRGIPSAVIRIAGFLIYMDDQFVPLGEVPACEGQCVLGALMGVGGSVWGILDAAATAGRENERRRAEARGIQVVPTLGPNGPGLSLSIPIDR